MDGGRYFFVVTIGAVLTLAVSLAAQSRQPPDRSAQSAAKAAQSSVHSIVLPQYPPELPRGPHLDTYQKDCLTCHSTRYVTMQPPFSRAVWEKEVKKMIDAYGATIPDADQREIVDYLVAVRGTSDPK